MAAVIAPTSVPLRRRALPAGVALLATEALDLVNVPAAGTLAQQAQDWLRSFRPGILQAPAHNDHDARALVSRVEQYISLVEVAANAISDLDTAHQNDGTATFLYQLQSFYDYLTNTRAELRELQNQQTLVKFACQTEIKNLLDQKQDELMNQAILFCVRYPWGSTSDRYSEISLFSRL
ncbi:hypothetical protein FRC12_004554 [Ceratobasidium sp. 428]|nr:hypothetical protein FRC12_004554 [Ceratobasidium sp. 428]